MFNEALLVLVTQVYMNNLRKLLKKLLPVRPEKATRPKRRKNRLEWQFAKRFALHANAIKKVRWFQRRNQEPLITSKKKCLQFEMVCSKSTIKRLEKASNVFKVNNKTRE